MSGLSKCGFRGRFGWRFRGARDDRFGAKLTHHARKLVSATGYYDLPNYNGVPGENLPKYITYYDDPHPYYGLDVAGGRGKNSAAIAALDLWRHGPRGDAGASRALHTCHVRYWIRPILKSHQKMVKLQAYFQSSILRIDETP